MPDEMGRQTIRLINVHISTAASGQSLSRRHFGQYLMRTSAARKDQAEALEKMIGGEAGPVIVAGDFNSPPGTYIHRLMAWNLMDCFEKAGFGHTYPVSKPLWRIDDILVGREFEVVECKTLFTKASDHLPVWAEVGLGVK